MRALVGLALLLVGSSTTFAGTIPRVNAGVEVTALKGAVAFCKEIPDRCTPHPSAIVSSTQEHVAELIEINDAVNKELTFQPEPKGVDIWQDRNFTSGDCEDYALLKRQRLIHEGWPPGALRIAIVTREEDDDEMHAILIASLSDADYVLDVPGKKSGIVRIWNEHEFYELESVWGADGKWYAIMPTLSEATVGAK